MVVTKYAPPPGYATLAATRPSSQPQSYAPAPQQYAYPPAPFGGYPAQAGAKPQPTYQLQGYSQHASPPLGSFPDPYPSAGSHPSTFEYSQQSPPTVFVTGHDRHSSKAELYGEDTKSYFPPGASHTRTQSSQSSRHIRHLSTPSITYDYAAAYARQEAGETFSAFAPTPLPNIVESFEPLEAEYNEGCYYDEHPEEIDEERSLGEIVSLSALPTPRPLAATFNEEELESIAPRPRLPRSDSCVSDYFTGEAAEAQLNTVRLSESWKEIKDDLIFKEFLQVGYETIKRDMMSQKYRNRIDADWERSDSSASISHLARASIETTGTVNADHRRGSRPPSRTQSRSGYRGNQDPMYPADQSVANGGRRGSQPAPNYRPSSAASNYRPSSAASNHSRASSVCSKASNQRPKALEPIHDQAQDDILARLGVTGSPKLVYETPGPAFGPPASGRSSRQSSVASVNENQPTTTPRAPSVPRQQQQDFAFNDPWSSNKVQFRPTHATGPRDLTSSEYTIMEDPDATPRANKGVKRHFDGDHHDPNNQKRLRDNEATPKQGRKQHWQKPAWSMDSNGRRW